jgi:hypothetical protein
VQARYCQQREVVGNCGIDIAPAAAKFGRCDGAVQGAQVFHARGDLDLRDGGGGVATLDKGQHFACPRIGLRHDFDLLVNGPHFSKRYYPA